MLKRSQRLKTREFAFAFENGRVLRHPLLQVRVYRREDASDKDAAAANTQSSFTRAAFVVPKKLGKATMRNRVRRKVRERYRLWRQKANDNLQKNNLQNCDLLFFINASSENATITEIDDALMQLLKRAGRL
jgi:ribonuclease P protein component